jgi:uncharacterized membrane protein YgdD (TMEM256/DUF423 family)
MDRVFLGLGAAFGLLGVAAGAFGAHAIREMISPERQATWETAARYHLYHALALLAVGLLLSMRGEAGSGAGPITLAGWAFATGIVIFAGSLYLLALTDIRWLGAITPLGGVAFLLGWALLGWGAVQK